MTVVSMFSGEVELMMNLTFRGQGQFIVQLFILEVYGFVLRRGEKHLKQEWPYEYY